MINGQKYDHEEVNIILPSGLAFGLTDLNYKDSQSVDARYGRGAKPRGYGRGNYESSGDGTLDRDQWELLKISLAASGKGKVYDHKPFNIVVSYGCNDLPLSVDVLKSVKITEFSTGYKQGDSNTGIVKISFIILEPIIWNGFPAK